MAGTFTLKPVDFEKVERALRELGRSTMRKVVNKAQRAGANIIAKEAKALAPVGKEDKKGKYPHKAGDLRRSIRVRIGKVRGKGEFKIIILAGADKSKWKNIYYPWWLEFGHRAGKANRADRGLIEKKSRTKDPAQKRALQARLEATSERKFVKPRPFLRPAFDNKKKAASDTIARTLREAIEAEWRKAK